jgi:hypothetical protein
MKFVLALAGRTRKGFDRPCKKKPERTSLLNKPSLDSSAWGTHKLWPSKFPIWINYKRTTKQP